jgi:cold shock CspA family protein
MEMIQGGKKDVFTHIPAVGKAAMDALAKGVKIHP